MSTSISCDQVEERMYNELRSLVEEVEEPEQRKKMLNRMIKQLRNAGWRKKVLYMDNHPFSNLRPAQLGIMITTEHLLPLYCLAFLYGYRYGLNDVVIKRAIGSRERSLRTLEFESLIR